MSKEALSVVDTLKLALEALDGAEALLSQMGLTHLLVYGNVDKSITAIKEALAQPEQGHPQAWLVYAKGSRRYFTLTFDIEKVPEIYKGGEAVPLCTTPPQRTWVGLTDEERITLFEKYGHRTGVLVGAVEDKLKEKNT